MKRAVIVVPQWGAIERNTTRELLARELAEHDAHLVGAQSEGTIEGETFRRLEPDPQAGVPRPTVDIYEAYWSDMAAADRSEGVVAQFFAATRLVSYWLLHPWWIMSFRARRAMPLGLAASGALLLAYYFVAAVALAHFVLELPGADVAAAVTETADDPGELAPAATGNETATGDETDTAGEEPMPPTRAIEIPGAGTLTLLVGALADWLRAPAQWLVAATSHAWFAVLLALLAVLPTLRIAALAGFTRHYLSAGETDGFAKDVQQRVQDTLKRVYRQPSPTDSTKPEYEEVFLLGHSLGAVIALEAIASYGDAAVQERTTLVTWGSPITILANRSRRIAEALRKATSGSVARWIDVHSSSDLFTAPTPSQAAHYRDASTNVRFAVGWWQSPTRAHDQYFFTAEALDVLLAPKSDIGEALPQPVLVQSAAGTPAPAE